MQIFLWSIWSMNMSNGVIIPVVSLFWTWKQFKETKKLPSCRFTRYIVLKHLKYAVKKSGGTNQIIKFGKDTQPTDTYGNTHEEAKKYNNVSVSKS